MSCLINFLIEKKINTTLINKVTPTLINTSPTTSSPINISIELLEINPGKYLNIDTSNIVNIEVRM